jgi:hypothetical protein
MPDMVWILDLLTPFRTTSDYSATADLHNSQITTASAKLFLARYVLTSHSLATASNIGDSSAFPAHVFPSPTPIQNCLPATPSTELDRRLFSASLEELNFTHHSTNWISGW